MTDQVISLLTVVVAGFVLFMRIKDYRKHKVVMSEVLQRDKLIEKFKLKGTRAALYLFAVATLAFVVMAFYNPDLFQGLTYIAVFGIMTFSEWINVQTVEFIHIFEKSAVYSGLDFRIKSIRAVSPATRRMVSVAMLDGKTHSVPVSVGDKLSELLKNRKAK